jgi:three-Cys-motif partner protein
MTQKFGGPWSLVKLDAVVKYLTAFNVALKEQPFNKIYIDAFAGSGSFTFKESESGPLFDRKEAMKVHAGSAQRALHVKPRFDKFIFIENDAGNVASLKGSVAKHPDADIEIIQGDANREVQRISAITDWRRTRGVIFLDPFGNSVEWKTIEHLGKTNLDVWYLFPLSGIYRNAPLDAQALTPDKEATLTRILGTSAWKDHFYVSSDSEEQSLFSLEPSNFRRSTPDDIQKFVHDRLKSVFPLVLPPRTLLGLTRAPMFSLFFAMGNPSSRAQEIASAIARHILRGW